MALCLWSLVFLLLMTAFLYSFGWGKCYLLGLVYMQPPLFDLQVSFNIAHPVPSPPFLPNSLFTPQNLCLSSLKSTLSKAPFSMFLLETHSIPVYFHSSTDIIVIPLTNME